MKKSLRTIAIACAVTLLATGCAKEQDLSGYVTTDDYNRLQEQIDNVRDQIPELPQQPQFYQFAVTFPAVNEAYFSEVVYNGLVGKINKQDALLLYMDWDNMWLQIPCSYGNNTINCFRNDNGVLIFSWGRALYQTFSQDAMVQNMRAIVIPAEAAATKGLMSMEQALALAGLTEADMQTL